MGKTLYRKYRSRSLDEIVGQEHITALLARSLAEGTVNHAYLLTGPHGVGKTSVARILAHAINDLEYSDDSNHLDIIEIDAASNNGVDDVRDLREKVHLAPTSARKKIYIIDEVHMLSKPAFNALLKTLEEPPEHVVFILATTDADKLPATIVSRVQRFNFRSISPDQASEHLRAIATQESIAIDDDALEIIARHGRGSFRDSIGLLDQLRSLGDPSKPISTDDVLSTLGASGGGTITELLNAARSGDLARLTQLLDNLEHSGAQASLVSRQLIDALQDSLDKHPEGVEIIDDLLQVGSSHYPYAKLLVALARSRGATAGLTTPPPIAPATTPITIKSKPSASKQSETSRPAPQQSAKHNTSSSAFDWQQLLKATADDVGLSVLLKKASGILDGDILTIYAGSKFTADQLKGPKQLPKLNRALTALGVDNYTVIIEGSKPPLNDSQAAAVAAIMGGGEEVELHE